MRTNPTLVQRYRDLIAARRQAAYDKAREAGDIEAVIAPYLIPEQRRRFTR